MRFVEEDWFSSPEHQVLYQQAIDALSRTAAPDSQWTAALFMLTGEPARWELAQRYIDWEFRGIHFDRMKADPALADHPRQESERFLLDLTHCMFNGGAAPELPRLWDTLSEDEFDQAVIGLMVLKTAWHGHA